MDPQIKNILQDLYSYDPEFMKHEDRLKSILEELIKSKPDTQFDPSFAESLRQKLAIQAETQTETQTNKFNLNLAFFKKPYFIWGGSLMAIALVLTILSFGQKDGKPFLSVLTGKIQKPNPNSNPALTDKTSGQATITGIKSFTSSEEFLAYLQETQNIQNNRGYGIGGGPATLMENSSAPLAKSGFNSTASDSGLAANQTISRVSDTNVQVAGIDEPDIVKTNGKQIYFSGPQNYYTYGQPGIMNKISPDAELIPSQYYQPKTVIVNALPPEQIKTLGKIDTQGEMLLYKNTLIIFSYDRIQAFDVSKPEAPVKSWTMSYNGNGQLVTARLKDGKIYLVTKNYPDLGTPCPLKPMSLDGAAIEIPCASIYHPIRPIPDTSTFNAFVMDATSGQVSKKLSFMGSFGQSLAYMSEESLYITYTLNKDQLDVMVDFLTTNGKDFLPNSMTDKLKKVQGYDISGQAKLVELQNILEKYFSSLSADDQKKLENNMQNKLEDYYKTRMRELVTTGIVKIALGNFEISATGEIPGTPLNQFSMDEYQGNLRIASTIGQGFWVWGWGGNSESANDVYVLNTNLKTIGSITDLGLTERIYAARFIGNRGYLVTFRQIDPFYVLDLSNPASPKKSGELKIPGYSSYLHPLDTNIILGVGQENGKVKLSLFDVSDPSNPKELDKYSMDEYWTEAANNHHAFLQDSKHGVFFLPGGQSGYIFNYKNGKLNLEKAVANIQAKRALYINDYLYIIGDNQITVLNESNWEKIKTLDLQ